VALTNLATVMAGFGMLAAWILIPELAQTPKSTGFGLGLDATRAGLLMLPGSFLMIVLGPISGALGSRVGNKVPLAIGGAFATISLVLLGAAHGNQWELMAFSALMSGGIGLSFAAMPNLIIDCVTPEQTGEATGFNALLRMVGMSLGAQVTAGVLAGSAVAAGAFPSDRGYSIAFLISGGAAFVGAVTAVLIPRPRRHGHLPALQEAGLAGPVPEPVFVQERR
jgi:MFS family permease